MYKTQFAQQDDDKNLLITKKNMTPLVTTYAILLGVSALAAWLLSGILTVKLLGNVSFLLHIIAVVLFWVKFNKTGSPFIYWLAVFASALAFYDWHPFHFGNAILANLVYIAILAGAVAFSMQKKRKIKEGFRAQKKIFNYWGIATFFYGTSLLMAFGFWKVFLFGYIYSASITIASVYVLLSALQVEDVKKG